MNTSDGIVLWSLGATGTLLIYAGYKNLKPQAVLAHYFTGAAYSASDTIQPTKPITGNKTPGDALIGPHDPAATPLKPGQTPDSGSKQQYTQGGGKLVNYNTQGFDPQAMPAAYLNNPASYIPAKALTA